VGDTRMLAAAEATLSGERSGVLAVLQRLGHFDIQPVLLSQALNVIVVQRLAPRLCQNCVREEEVAPAMLDSLRARHIVEAADGAVRLPRPVGCDACDRTGRKGRVAMVEVLSLQDDMRAVLASGCPPAELLARAGEAHQFMSFAKYARVLIGRRLLAPADALLAVAE
jgi:general secretion pathway protein E